MEITGKYIKEWRVLNDKTRRELASMLGVNWMTVYRWERELRKPSPMAVVLLKKLMATKETPTKVIAQRDQRFPSGGKEKPGVVRNL